MPWASHILPCWRELLGLILSNSLKLIWEGIFPLVGGLKSKTQSKKRGIVIKTSKKSLLIWF